MANIVLSASNIYTHKGERDFLGSGSFGQVRRCFLSKQDTAAVKIFKVSGSKEQISKRQKMIESELDILKRMEESPYVVNVFGLVNMYQFSGIVMEYVPRGNLSEFIEKSGKLAPLVLRFQMLLETATGITHLHNTTFAQRVTHNDIKPSNILLDVDYHVKICDFGGSNYTYHTNWTAVNVRLDASRVHSERCAAPEFLEGREKGEFTRTTAMDVYSFATVSLFVLTEGFPSKFEFPEDSKLPFDLSSELERKTYEDLRGWTIKCSNNSPNQRPNMKEVSQALAKYKSQAFVLSGVETAVATLKEKFPLESAEIDEDCIPLAKFFWQDSSEKTDESNPVVGSGVSMIAIKVSDFNHVLTIGEEIAIQTPNESYVCEVKECRK